MPRNPINGWGSRDVLLTRGVHGWRGRWLVNGSRHNIAEMDIDPRARGTLMVVVPLKLRLLAVSVEEPDRFLSALSVPLGQPA